MMITCQIILKCSDSVSDSIRAFAVLHREIIWVILDFIQLLKYLLILNITITFHSIQDHHNLHKTEIIIQGPPYTTNSVDKFFSIADYTHTYIVYLTFINDLNSIFFWFRLLIIWNILLTIYFSLISLSRISRFHKN